MDGRRETTFLSSDQSTETIRGLPDKLMYVDREDNNDEFLAEYFVQPWRLYLDECRYILIDWEWASDTDDREILVRYENVKRYEEELN